MVKVICDKCQKDCELNAYVITVDVIHNPHPYNVKDTYSKPSLTDDTASMRFCLCQDCYRQLGFPNIYKVLRKGKLTEEDWRDKE